MWWFLKKARVPRVDVSGAAAQEPRSRVEADLLAQVWADLHRLIGRYLLPQQGYAARRAVFTAKFPGDYDHLARFGEWEMTDAPVPESVG